MGRALGLITGNTHTHTHTHTHTQRKGRKEGRKTKIYIYETREREIGSKLFYRVLEFHGQSQELQWKAKKRTSISRSGLSPLLQPDCFAPVHYYSDPLYNIWSKK
jgi:hypothetical protein